jgi:hypothetical protein
MDILKKIFPYSFGVKDLTDMIVKIVVYVIVGAVAGVLIGILKDIFIIGAIIGACGGLVDVYCTVGIVLSILDHFKVLK